MSYNVINTHLYLLTVKLKSKLYLMFTYVDILYDM